MEVSTCGWLEGSSFKTDWDEWFEGSTKSGSYSISSDSTRDGEKGIDDSICFSVKISCKNG